MVELDITALQYTISPTRPAELKFWLGAILRNNLLRHLYNIKIEGRSLSEIINTLPLLETHPLYAELCNGFPRGYVIHCEPILEQKTILVQDKIKFQILLFGSFGSYADYFDQAVANMCSEGICLHRVSFQILHRAHCRLLPFSFADNAPNKKCRITYLTPSMLFNNRAKSKEKRLTLDLQNATPGFYQLTKSLAHRLNKLQLLYGNGTYKTFKEIHTWISQAREPQLEEAQLKRIVLRGTPRENGTNIFYSGYVGSVVYSGPIGKYIPLLMIGRYLGAGNDVVYGLGQYEIAIEQ